MMEQISSPTSFTGRNTPTRDPSLGPRSPTSTRSRTRQFVALNPDPISSSSSGTPVLVQAIRPSHGGQFQPNSHIQPPPNIHAPLSSHSPAPSVMNVDPGARVLGVAGQGDLEYQRTADAVHEEQRSEGVLRRNTLGKGKRLIGGFVPWLRNSGNNNPPRLPPVAGLQADMMPVRIAATESKSTSQSQSDRSYDAEFQPIPPIRVESPSSHNTSHHTPFIPPTPQHAGTYMSPSPSRTSFQHHQPPSHRPPSPSIEGTTLVDHGTLMSGSHPMTEAKFTDPAPLALPNSPEYKPLPHSTDYAKMEPYPQRSETELGKAIKTHPLIAKIKTIMKTIDEFPWIGEDRITVDYYPTRKTKDGKPWRFGNYEKRLPPMPSPTRPHGGRLPNERQGSPTFGYHRASRYDFGIRRSQFSRMRRPRSKRSNINSWYDGRSQGGGKELDLLSSGSEVDPFPPPMPMPPIATSEPRMGQTPVSMKTIPLYEQRIVNGQAVDVDVDQERAMMEQANYAANEAQRHSEQGYAPSLSHHQAPSVSHSHAPSASVRSPTIILQSPPPPTHQPRKPSRSRSRDQGQPVYATKTPIRDFPSSHAHSHNRSHSVDYYVSASQQGIPPQNFMYSGSEGRRDESPEPSRTGSMRVSSPRKPKRKSHGRSRSATTHQYQAAVPAAVYYPTPPPIPSGYGHQRYFPQGEPSSGPRREEYYAVPI